MPNVLGSFTDTLAARGELTAPGSAAAAAAFRASGATLETLAANAAATEDQWRTALVTIAIEKERAP
jgi:hypothetical protein